MCFWLNKAVQEEGEKPYYPLVAVWADAESGMILHHEVDRPENGPGILQTALLQAMEDSNTVPEQVAIQSDTAVRLLQPVTDRLGIQLTKLDELPSVEAAVQWLQSCVVQGGDEAPTQEDKAEDDIFTQVQNANYELLALFESWLTEQGLSQSTRVRHLHTMDLFLNSFLMDIGPMSPDEGIFKLDEFFCNWLPRATPWVSSSAVQGMVPGLKKFAVCLQQQGLLAQEDLQDFMALIKARRKTWEQAGHSD